MLCLEHIKTLEKAVSLPSQVFTSSVAEQACKFRVTGKCCLQLANLNVTVNRHMLTKIMGCSNLYMHLDLGENMPSVSRAYLQLMVEQVVPCRLWAPCGADLHVQVWQGPWCSSGCGLEEAQLMDIPTGPALGWSYNPGEEPMVGQEGLGR